MSATIHRLPPVYRIEYLIGEASGIVPGFDTRRRWEAEEFMYYLSLAHPEVNFWVIPNEDDPLV